jgi:hypothetical protein
VVGIPPAVNSLLDWLHWRADLPDTKVLPLQNVNCKVLEKVYQYFDEHDAVDDEGKPKRTAEELAKWDEEYLSVDQPELFELILVRPCLLP